MMNEKRSLSIFLGMAVFYAVCFAGRGLWTEWYQAVRLETAKSSYLHYEFVDIVLRARDPRMRDALRRSPPRAAVTRDGKRVATVAGIGDVPLRYDEASRVWTARWPCPWNAPAGTYGLELLGEPAWKRRLRAKPFRIAYRRPAPIPKGLTVLTWESVRSLKGMKVRTPSGRVADWRGLLDWVEYVGADAFWVLGGRTPGARPGEVWATGNLSVFPELARECRKRGIKFGIYVMAYLTVPDGEKPSRYDYSRTIKDGETRETRAISISDPRRPRDVAELLRRFRDIPGVDYLGLDYIRAALGGYELVDEFFAEFPGLARPKGWETFNHEERMLYLARKKIMRRDKGFVEAWQWWRAHRVARIVRSIKDEVGDTKPLWAFTLTWDKGWHHGQDPVMMNDAGVDVDALMLYEADGAQFDAILHDWSRYVKRSDVQLLVGNVVDWPLHQRAEDGPRAFSRRMTRAVDGIFSDGPAHGVFYHDLERALRGRLGPWSTREWMDEARRVTSHMRSAVERVDL